MPINRFDINPLAYALESNALVLVPNHRIRDAILAAHAAANERRVFRTPNVVAVDIWIEEVWRNAANRAIPPFCDYQLMGATEELFVWTSVIEKSMGQIPLLNPEETALTVNQSYRQLKQWLLDDPDLKQVRLYDGNPDVAVFLDWIGQYQEYCDKHQLISLVDCTELLIAQLAEGVQLQLPAQIFLVNFFQPPPLYSHLFEQLTQTTSVEALRANDDLTPGSKLRYEFPDQQSEIIACASWAKKIMQDNPAAHIGIIVNQEQPPQATLERIFRDVIAPQSLFDATSQSAIFNCVSSKQRLVDSPLVHDALLLLNLCNEYQDSNDFCRLLQSAHVVASTVEQQARIQMVLFMHRYLGARCSITELTWHLNNAEKPTHSPKLADALLKIRTRYRKSEKSMNTSQWTEFITDLLTDAGWPGDSHSKLQQNLLSQWQDTLNLFAKAGNAVGNISFTTMLTRLRMLCSKQQLRVNFNPHCQLSLYSINEALGLRFDHLWLLGFDDSLWPPAASPSAFIPHTLQKELEMAGSHSDIQYQLAVSSFDLLCGSAAATIVASHHQYEDEKQLRPSSFIHQFNKETTPVAASSPINSYAESLRAAHRLQRVDDLDCLPLQENEQVQGGQSIISNQSSCPFRAFAKHRLHAEPLPEFQSGLTSMARGTAIHIALEHLFEAIHSSSELQELSESEREDLVQHAAKQATDYLGQRYQQLMTPRFKAIEHRRISALLVRFLKLEAERSDFKVMTREQELTWTRDKLTLNLKIDRVDQLDDGSLALIDYKTGKFSSNRNSLLDARPEDMQLPLYYAVSAEQQEQPISAVNIAHVNVEKMAYSGVAAGDNFHAKVKPWNQEDFSWQQLTEAWQQKVELFAAEFIDGKLQVAPVKGSYTCQYCGIQSLCRIRELSESLVDDNDLEDER